MDAEQASAGRCDPEVGSHSLPAWGFWGPMIPEPTAPVKCSATSVTLGQTASSHGMVCVPVCSGTSEVCPPRCLCGYLPYSGPVRFLLPLIPSPGWHRTPWGLPGGVWGEAAEKAKCSEALVRSGKCCVRTSSRMRPAHTLTMGAAGRLSNVGSNSDDPIAFS